MWAPAVTGHICSILFTGIQTQPQWPGFVHAEPPNILICAPQSTALVNFSLAITSDLSLPRSPPLPENMWSYVPPVGCGQKWACSGDTGLPAHPKHSKPTPTSHSPLPHGVPEVTLLVKLCYLSLQTLVNERRRCKMTSISDARLGLYFFNQITWLPALVIAPSRVCFGAVFGGQQACGRVRDPPHTPGRHCDASRPLQPSDGTAASRPAAPRARPGRCAHARLRPGRSGSACSGQWWGRRAVLVGRSGVEASGVPLLAGSTPARPPAERTRCAVGSHLDRVAHCARRAARPRGVAVRVSGKWWAVLVGRSAAGCPLRWDAGFRGHSMRVVGWWLAKAVV